MKTVVNDQVALRLLNRSFMIAPQDRLYLDSVLGFDPATVYRTYDEYINDTERYFIEYFLRDAYEYYGYDFQYYDGKPVDEARAEELVKGCTTIDGYIREVWRDNVLAGTEIKVEGKEPTDEDREKACEEFLDNLIAEKDVNRLLIDKTLMRGLRFVNLNGQPLRMMPMLELDPALLEQPLYH